VPNLNDREWIEIFLGDLFIVKRPNARSEKQYQDGTIPFVASGNANNGLIKCCAKQPNELLDEGNCITVSPVDGSGFYQEANFLGRGGAGSSILLLYNDCLNKYSGLFISRMIRQTCSKYCYGKMGNKESIKREKIMLPVSEDGTLDYYFMEQYIKEREEQLIKKYETLLGKNNKAIEIKLESSEWQPFYIKKIFDEPQRGKRIVKKNHSEGFTPLVSSYGQGNGVTHFVGNKKSVRKFSNCLSVANGGSSAGTTFYHPYVFVASDHVTQCWNANLNQYQYLFLATAMEKTLIGKYSFSHEISDPRLAKEKIMLPVLPSGEPDYAFMEQYGKNLMLQKYQQYFDYITAKSAH